MAEIAAPRNVPITVIPRGGALRHWHLRMPWIAQGSIQRQHPPWLFFAKLSADGMASGKLEHAVPVSAQQRPAINSMIIAGANKKSASNANMSAAPMSSPGARPAN